jgi:hypothetical protein
VQQFFCLLTASIDGTGLSSAVDGSIAFMLIVAVGCVAAGAYWSSGYERAAQQHRYQPLQAPAPQAPPNGNGV